MTPNRTHKTARLAPFAALAGLGALAALTAPALAGQDPSGLYLFRGDNKAVSGITPRPWGSGTVEEYTQLHFSGTQSFRIITQGMHQGAALTFAKPVDLAPYLANKNAYLQFTVQLPELNAQGGGGLPGGPPGAGSMGGKGSGSGPGSPSGPSGGGSMGGGRGGPAAQARTADPAENLRVLLISTKGRTHELLLPVDYARDDQGWKQMNIPLTAIRGVTPDTAQIKEIRVSADSIALMYLGQIRIATDATPIRLEKLPDVVMQRNARRQFFARATAGLSPLKFSWDFDDSNGVQEEKEGRRVQHVYRKAGDFVVTLTAADPYGLRESIKTSFKVHVTP